MKTYITGNISVALCDWIYDDMTNRLFDRAKFNRLLRLSMKYNTNNLNDIERWVYDSDKQMLRYYYETYRRAEIWFKEQKCIRL